MEEAMVLGTLSSAQSHSSETKSDWLLSRTPTSQSQVSKYGPLLLRVVLHHHPLLLQLQDPQEKLLAHQELEGEALVE
jgi:hypothetical protein